MTWLRESLGVALLALGLFFFFHALGYIRDEKVLDGGLVVLMGIIIFNAGLHLLKVAAASRILSRREPDPDAHPAPPAGRPKAP